MAVTDQQKLDFLLKKIGYTKTKTGSVVGTGAISGTQYFQMLRTRAAVSEFKIVVTGTYAG